MRQVDVGISQILFCRHSPPDPEREMGVVQVESAPSTEIER